MVALSCVLGLPEDTLECLTKFLYKDSECDSQYLVAKNSTLRHKWRLCVGSGRHMWTGKEGGGSFVFLYIVSS